MSASAADAKPEDGSGAKQDSPTSAQNQGLDTSQIALISKENDRLTDLHREQCEMFSAEMSYLKQKLGNYKKENEQLEK